MNEGEPPDQTGESGHGPPEDGEAAGEDDDEDAGTDAPADDADAEAAAAETDGRDDGSGEDADEEPVVDPGEEVEAAVREVMGPEVLDDGLDGDGEADEADGEASDGEAASTDGTVEGSDVDEPGADADGTATDDAGDTAADASTGSAGPGENGDGSAAAEPGEATGAAAGEPREDVPPDVRKYDRFKKIDGGTYDRANDFLRDRTYITAREWAMARLCADFRTETGVEMTKIGENLPELVPFMTDTYTPQAVNQARSAFEEKVRKAGATFLYGAMCDFFTAEELDDVMYEATEVAKFLLEVEGVELSVEEELAAEDHISEVMREVREHSAALRHDEVTCPECGHHIEAHDD